MLATIYRFRQKGLRLDAYAIEADPIRGELRVLKGRAVLIDIDGTSHMLRPLEQVRLLAVNERGMLLAGQERHPPRDGGPTYPQTWWCALRATQVVTDPAAQEIGRTMAAHSKRRR